MALIDDLGPGERLAITRDGEPIATISGTLGVVVRTGTPDSDDALEEPPNTRENVTVVATAMKLSASARASLSTQLGSDYIVLDLHEAPPTADVLLVPPVSPQLIGGLRSMFPEARVIVTEIEDDELGISYHGPIRRLLDAGADAYLPPTTVPRLAGQLHHTLTQRRELTNGTAEPREIEPLRGHQLPEGG
ncbi:hypothetical protein [Streptomyces sp. NPDC003077]|uniref:hypothetical protein n=1 Tax=Streptomyces sp. NPDC003077 TaxID=3154443 RepID=UPI0033AF7FFF